MILFFKTPEKSIIAVNAKQELSLTDIEKLLWLFGGAEQLKKEILEGWFVGPRKEMLTPWSTNAVEITQNMGVPGIVRMEEYIQVLDEKAGYDPMLKAMYHNLDQKIFTIDKKPDPIMAIEDIATYNEQEGLALSQEEIDYLNDVSKKLGRKLTDSEVFGFSQVNSEHCRHKIFNGSFIIDGVEQEMSLFQMIKKTSKENPNTIISAYKDNCSFVQGPVVEQFAPATQDKPDFFEVKDIETVLSLKAETHNFPTTVEPFNGASTGTGGEIRDRIAGGKGSLPIAGTAVYMTSYPRTESARSWEQATEERDWLYQTPEEILIKASNGASDFGNKFGQPIITGSVLTFEHFEAYKKYGFDKVIMLAGGIGFGAKKDSLKEVPTKGDKVVLLGGDNYRIGMGGGAVSSVDTGEFDNAIELNAVQRANPEMQKRAYNAIRALAESDNNPIISIHDHGAGGHLNCLSELVEATGGKIDTAKLPVGDPTLSQKEIVGNESQERMGLVIHEKDVELLQKIADRERAPMYVIGESTGDMQFTFENSLTGEKPIDWQLSYMFGKPPKTVLTDKTVETHFDELKYNQDKIEEYLENVLQLESVACKDWLTNKVDRSVTGRIAKQQTAGKIQLPLNNVGVITLDYQGKSGIATTIGHAPVAALVSAENGSILAIAESLTNIVFAPLADKMKSVSLSANWMWPAKNEGENARIYKAVKAASDFTCALGINIPTGKDSMSMTQKYKDDVVYAPGTVIISASGEVTDVKKVVEPVLVNDPEKAIYLVDFSQSGKALGGSAFSQIINKLGNETPTVADPAYFVKAFNAIQEQIEAENILAGHDISSGGLITTLLEMCFTSNETGMQLDLSGINEKDTVKLIFSENPGLVLQPENSAKFETGLKAAGVAFVKIGQPTNVSSCIVTNFDAALELDIASLRDLWFKSSYLLDRKQSGEKLALERYKNYKKNELQYDFKNFTGKAADYGIDLKRRKPSGIKAAIIREKGVNGDREMAYAMYLAGMDVKDVHMTDLISGRETLEDLNMIVFVGGFSNSDVLGSAKGWAGAFKYNEKARLALENFYKRSDTLSLGVCNGCQLMVELGLIYPDHNEMPKMLHNESHKFESSFVNIEISANNSVMLGSMAGQKLGVWVAHGEGKFSLPKTESEYKVTMKYLGEGYPANPNGSMYNIAGLCSNDGRHLVMMPHLERAFRPYHWPYYPKERKGDEIAPWMEAFVNAKKWIEKNKK
ncbi:MAG: phosphoribosylformylglycinamidine synthase [Bacteroidetes bacterium GWF2_42_66]|nr:MAG: phosphoribosylformylglycinamidine synthase [Bacteroidetes bacterium GWA2_42_15]OFX98768.1 MAG: phosphoribosylformylglycinamidine synthase [Bacteroidetes bacterium GWE2_42_39]OFY43035.1 MAG: phosphoribosylformylglycinamidine synthase [Bacteroidetes bacterium GWF2_42_66]HBL77125.1 phosphoribosylformylglycinamidine synthase [Prolixibacteraceae bacterium]HCU59821.1 phosphoribosylformylglycinamidine synthase [Prolixibacteraceae bacterium]